MDDESIRLLKKISQDVESLKDNMRLVHTKLATIEKSVETAIKFYEDIEDVRNEMNRYFELRNPMS